MLKSLTMTQKCRNMQEYMERYCCGGNCASVGCNKNDSKIYGTYFKIILRQFPSSHGSSCKPKFVEDGGKICEDDRVTHSALLGWVHTCNVTAYRNTAS